MRILGVTASGFTPLGAYELIETVILGTATSSVTFSSLGTYSSTYKHLQIRAVGRTDLSASGDGDAIKMRFNNDSGANYSTHQLYGVNNTVNSAYPSISGNSVFLNRFTDSGSTANTFGAFVCDLLDVYSATKNKTTRMLGGNPSNSNYIFLMSGAWYNTSALTSIQLLPNVGTNFVSGSRFSLYGIKG
jgi:hypothetical protein